MVLRRFWQGSSGEYQVPPVRVILITLGSLLSFDAFAAAVETGNEKVAMSTHLAQVDANSSMPSIAEDLAPDELIRTTGELLLDDIRQNRSAYEADSRELFAKVREWVFPHFDFQRISRYVLGSAWKEASEELQQRFTQEFSTLMLHTYGSALMAFQDQRVEYLPYDAKESATRATVKILVHDKEGSAIPIDYLLANVAGQWKVLDVKIDGISLVKTYRSEYGSIVKREGIPELITALEERNRRNL